MSESTNNTGSDDQVLDFIRQERESGKNEFVIRQTLTQAGWEKAQIDRAFDVFYGRTTNKVDQDQKGLEAVLGAVAAAKGIEIGGGEATDAAPRQPRSPLAGQHTLETPPWEPQRPANWLSRFVFGEFRQSGADWTGEDTGASNFVVNNRAVPVQLLPALGVLLFLAGILVTAVGLSVRQTGPAKNELTATGTVGELATVQRIKDEYDPRPQRDTSRRATISYQDKDGRTRLHYEFWNPADGDRLTVGQKVTVVYDPKSPTTTSWVDMGEGKDSSFVNSLVFFGAGLILVAIFMWMGYTGRRLGPFREDPVTGKMKFTWH